MNELFILHISFNDCIKEYILGEEEDDTFNDKKYVYLRDKIITCLISLLQENL